MSRSVQGDLAVLEALQRVHIDPPEEDLIWNKDRPFQCELWSSSEDDEEERGTAARRRRGRGAGGGRRSPSSSGDPRSDNDETSEEDEEEEEEEEGEEAGDTDEEEAEVHSTESVPASLMRYDVNVATDNLWPILCRNLDDWTAAHHSAYDRFQTASVEPEFGLVLDDRAERTRTLSRAQKDKLWYQICADHHEMNHDQADADPIVAQTQHMAETCYQVLPTDYKKPQLTLPLAHSIRSYPRPPTEHAELRTVRDRLESKVKELSDFYASMEAAYGPRRHWDSLSAEVEARCHILERLTGEKDILAQQDVFALAAAEENNWWRSDEEHDDSAECSDAEVFDTAHPDPRADRRPESRETRARATSREREDRSGAYTDKRRQSHDYSARSEGRTVYVEDDEPEYHGESSSVASAPSSQRRLLRPQYPPAHKHDTADDRTSGGRKLYIEEDEPEYYSASLSTTSASSSQRRVLRPQAPLRRSEYQEVDYGTGTSSRHRPSRATAANSRRRQDEGHEAPPRSRHRHTPKEEKQVAKKTHRHSSKTEAEYIESSHGRSDGTHRRKR